MSFGGRDIFKYALVDIPTNLHYYVDNGGRILTGAYKFLRYSPEGWMENRVAFGRSSKYFGINRGFTVPLKFVGDGAKIIRYLILQKRGIEQPLGLIIWKWNPSNDTYEPYYKGVIDLPKANNKVAEGVTVSVMEGGVVQMLKAFENTVYQIPCDGTIPENLKVKLDGILFNDVFHYTVVPVTSSETTVDGLTIIIPSVFTTNDGDNIGIVRGDQTYEEAPSGPLAPFFQGSSNSLFYGKQDTVLNFKGKLKIRTSGNAIIQVRLWSSTGTPIIFLVNPTNLNGLAEYSFDVNITLPAEQKLFYTVNIAGSGLTLDILESFFDITFSSRYQTTETWGITAYDLFRLLVQKMNESSSTSLQTFNYRADSQLLEQYKNLVVCSGDSLRAGNDPTYPGPVVIKTSLSDFFDTFNAILGGSLSNHQVPGLSESIFFEEKEFVFDASEITMDIGEVSDLEMDIATEYYFNQLKIGFPNQEYDQKAGKYEYNTTAQWTPPIKTIAKELSLVSKYRADSFGIEYTRFNSGGKSTTHNNSDNSVFILNVDQQSAEFSKYSSLGIDLSLAASATNVPLPMDAIIGDYFSNNELFTLFTFARALTMRQFTLLWGVAGTVSGSGTATFDLLKNGSIISTITPGPGVFDLSMELPGEILNINDTIEIRYTTPAGLSGTLTGAFFEARSEQILLYPLRRTEYDAITGIPNATTAFNIDDLTPKRMFLKQAPWLNGVLFNLIPDRIIFQTLDRNQSLSTSLSGQVITENASIPISTLPAPLFYPFVLSFKTKVPLNFTELMNGAANGHIKFSYNGVDIYGFPMEVSQKPALNESQEWKLLCSPQTILADLVDLDIDGINYIDMAGYGTFIPHLCPVHFVKLGYVNPPKYHTLTMEQDWFKNRVKKWVQNNDYFNPWQNDDIIRLQCITNGLGPVQVQIMDCQQNVVDTLEMNIVASDAVKAPYILYELNIPLSSIDEGLYYLVLTAGAGSAQTIFVSEGLWVKEDWPETILFEYSNKVNKQAMIFSTGYTPSFRVEGRIVRYEPGAKFSTYENQPADMEMEDGIAYDTYKLEIGFTDGGVPDYVIRKANRIMLLTSTFIDGTGYTRNGSTKFERTNFPGQPKEFWSLDIRNTDNRDGITVSTDGTIDTNISIVYNVATTAFGDNSGVSNVIQVTEENQ